MKFMGRGNEYLVKSRRGKGFRFGKYTLDGELVKIYDSMTEAARENNVKVGKVRASVYGLKKEVDGFKYTEISQPKIRKKKI